MGGSVSNEELVGFVATLAGLVDKNIERAGKLDEQAKRSLDQMVKGNEALQKQILAIADDVRAKYAPAAVEETAKAGKEAIDELKEVAFRAAETIRLAASVGIKGIQEARSEWRARFKVGLVCVAVSLVLAPGIATLLPKGARAWVAATVLGVESVELRHGAVTLLGDPEAIAHMQSLENNDQQNSKQLNECRAEVQVLKSKHL